MSSAAIVSKRFWFEHQSANYESLFRNSEAAIRIRIKYDSCPTQSYGVAELFDRIHNEWHVVVSIPYSKLECRAVSSYLKANDAKYFVADEKRLLGDIALIVG